MSGVEFVDGPVSGSETSPFESGSMQAGGPVDGPLSAGDRTADVNISGDMPAAGNSVIESPCDY